jgi:hypothetical protein
VLLSRQLLSADTPPIPHPTVGIQPQPTWTPARYRDRATLLPWQHTGAGSSGRVSTPRPAAAHATTAAYCHRPQLLHQRNIVDSQRRSITMLSLADPRSSSSRFPATSTGAIRLLTKGPNPIGYTVNVFPWVLQPTICIGKPGPVTRSRNPCRRVVHICFSSAQGHCSIFPTGLIRPCSSATYAAQTN